MNSFPGQLSIIYVGLRSNEDLTFSKVSDI